MISVMTEPETLDEIRRSVDAKCAAIGISRSTFSVETLRKPPHVLNFLLTRRTKPSANPEIVAQVSEWVNVKDPMAWER